MHFFRESCRRHFRTPSAAFSRTIITSSVAATFFYFVSNDEKSYFFKVGRKKDEDNDEDVVGSGSPTGIWNFPTVASFMTPIERTHCLATSDPEKSKQKSQIQNVVNGDRPRLIFLGTGSSTGCPKPICSMKFHKNALLETPSSKSSSTPTMMKRPDPKSCHVSYRALAGGDPKSNRDYRNNPSLLIHHYDEHSESYKNIIIDVGKTFRETALRWFPINEVESLDAIILTHHHMDAAAGLDDVRGFQGIKWIADDEKKENKAMNGKKDGRYVRQSIPLYMSAFCHLNLQSQFPWLLPKKSGKSVMPQQQKNGPTVKRDVASFDVTIFKDYQEEQIVGPGDGRDNTTKRGFTIVPLPVWHGDDLISHGFAFSLHPGPSSSSSRPLNVVYLSDISRMVPKTLEFIKNKLPQTDILVVDSLLWDKTHPVHYSMEQAVQLSRMIQPRVRTYLIGMSCDNFLPNDEMNAYLRETYGTGDGNDNDGAIVMAHDGLVVELPGTNT